MKRASECHLGLLARSCSSCRKLMTNGTANMELKRLNTKLDAGGGSHIKLAGLGAKVVMHKQSTRSQRGQATQQELQTVLPSSRCVFCEQAAGTT